MNTTLAVALLIPWIFWGILILLLIISRRSWVNMLILPTVLSILILAIAKLSSIQEAFWTSLILHIFLLIFFIGSYILFILKQRKT